eukprot:2368355-Pleurochrysis_carterae.AAC.3
MEVKGACGEGGGREAVGVRIRRVASLLAQIIGPAYEGRGDTAPGGEIHTPDPGLRAQEHQLGAAIIDVGCEP